MGTPEEENCWIGKIADGSVTHHELMKFTYIFATENPIVSHKGCDIYMYDDVVYYALIEGRAVTLIKVV